MKYIYFKCLHCSAFFSQEHLNDRFSYTSQIILFVILVRKYFGQVVKHRDHRQLLIRKLNSLFDAIQLNHIDPCFAMHSVMGRIMVKLSILIAHYLFKVTQYD